MAEETVLHHPEIETGHEPFMPADEFASNSPMKVSYGKMMMWYFLLSDAFTFSAFLISYGAIRMSNAWWPDPNHVFNAMPFMGHRKIPLGFVSIMTFILILSSVAVVLAVIEGHRMNKKGVLKWMLGGIIGGAAFLGCQAWEWAPGPVAFGALFFGITGFHGFHVFTGVCLNVWGFFATLSGKFEKVGHYEMIEKLGLYWHFVDLVWVFVFLAFYLL